MTDPTAAAAAPDRDLERRDRRRGPAVRIWAGVVVVLVVGLAALTLWCLRLMTAPVADLPAAQAALDQYRQGDGWLTLAGIGGALGLLVLGDALVLWAKLRSGFARMLLLWLPFLLFIAFSLVQWKLLDDAYVGFKQSRGLTDGSFSGALILALVADLVALVVTFGNQVVLNRVQHGPRTLPPATRPLLKS